MCSAGAGVDRGDRGAQRPARRAAAAESAGARDRREAGPARGGPRRGAPGTSAGSVRGGSATGEAACDRVRRAARAAGTPLTGHATAHRRLVTPHAGQPEDALRSRPESMMSARLERLRVQNWGHLGGHPHGPLTQLPRDVLVPAQATTSIPSKDGVTGQAGCLIASPGTSSDSDQALREGVGRARAGSGPSGHTAFRCSYGSTLACSDQCEDRVFACVMPCRECNVAVAGLCRPSVAVPLVGRASP
jgi:hypothetical protein